MIRHMSALRRRTLAALVLAIAIIGVSLPTLAFAGSQTTGPFNYTYGGHTCAYLGESHVTNVTLGGSYTSVTTPGFCASNIYVQINSSMFADNTAPCTSAVGSGWTYYYGSWYLNNFYSVLWNPAGSHCIRTVTGSHAISIAGVDTSPWLQTSSH